MTKRPILKESAELDPSFRAIPAARFLRTIVGGLLLFLAQETWSDQGSSSSAKVAEMQPISPKEPKDTIGTFQCGDGFHMDLIAAEPLIMSPVSICYDENGNMYVAEMTDYPFADGQANGRIRLLRDLDGDGKFDTSSVFVDGLRSPSSIACWKGGIFVSTHGEIWYFKSSGSSEVASERVKVLSGFGLGSLEYMQNGLVWGIDHKIYGAAGPNGGTVQTVDAKAKPVSLARQDFRFDPISFTVEAISGGSQWGNTFDDSYNRFVCRNIAPARHLVLPLQYLGRNPFLKVPRLYHPLTSEEGDVPVYRISPPEAWRVARARLRQELGKNANPGEINEAGYFTAACGITIYRGDAYPESWRGNLFIAEPAGNLVHRRSLQADRVTFASHRLDEKSEVIASSDTFFRPVNLVNAPDGTLHVVDMYRELVEDPKYVPSDLIAAGKVNVKGGQDRGRIYRLTPPNFKVPKPPRLGKASIPELVAQLENPSSWWRETAQRLIYERQDPSAVNALRKLLAQSSRPLARLHALWALDGLDALRSKDIAPALSDHSPVLREHALRLAEKRLECYPDLPAIVHLAKDPAPRIRLQLAFTLGEAKGLAPTPAESSLTQERVVAALAEVARQDVRDVWVRTAVLSSSFECAAKLFETLLRSPEFSQRSEGKSFLKELAFTVGRRNLRDEAEYLLSALAAMAGKPDQSGQTGFVAGLAEGLNQSGSDLMERLSSDTTSPASQMFSRALNEAHSIAADPSLAADLRQDAVTLLGYGRFEKVRDVLVNLLEAHESEEVQLASIRALTMHRHADIPTVLLEHWRSSPPSVQGEILDALLARKEWINPLLEALENETVPMAMIGATRRNSLLNHSEHSIRERAAALFGTSVAKARDAVVNQYKPAIQLPGDRTRGQQVFERACVACHRFAGKGNEIGPNLSAYGQEAVSSEKLLISILDPNREVSPVYTAYVVELKDGRSLTGIIETQTPGSITFKQAGDGRGLVILRSDIKEMKSSSLSLMPEGLEESIRPQEMSDLLAFLTAIRGGI